MPTFICRYCAHEFEAAKKRVYCTKDHQQKARVNIYAPHGNRRVAVLHAPSEGWILGSSYIVPLDGDKGDALQVTLSPDSPVKVDVEELFGYLLPPRP